MQKQKVHISRYIVSPFATNCYVVSGDGRECVIIDPGGDPEVILAGIRNRQLRPIGILLTHGHIDHVAALPELHERYRVPAAAHKAEEQMIAHVGEQALLFGLPNIPPVNISQWCEDGDLLEFGPFQFTVIHTPGHSLGSCCYLIQNYLFSGDTLFELSVGRTDLPGGDPDALFQSIKTKLFKLPSNIEVFPGHGDKTTIEREKNFNPFLRGAL